MISSSTISIDRDNNNNNNNTESQNSGRYNLNRESPFIDTPPDERLKVFKENELAFKSSLLACDQECERELSNIAGEMALNATTDEEISNLNKRKKQAIEYCLEQKLNIMKIRFQDMGPSLSLLEQLETIILINKDDGFTSLNADGFTYGNQLFERVGTLEFLDEKFLEIIKLRAIDLYIEVRAEFGRRLLEVDKNLFLNIENAQRDPFELTLIDHLNLYFDSLNKIAIIDQIQSRAHDESANDNALRIIINDFSILNESYASLREILNWLVKFKLIEPDKQKVKDEELREYVIKAILSISEENLTKQKEILRIAICSVPKSQNFRKIFGNIQNINEIGETISVTNNLQTLKVLLKSLLHAILTRNYPGQLNPNNPGFKKFFIDDYNATTDLIQVDILNKNNLKNRLQAIVRWLHLLEFVYSQKCYNITSKIYAAINNYSINKTLINDQFNFLKLLPRNKTINFVNLLDELQKFLTMAINYRQKINKHIEEGVAFIPISALMQGNLTFMQENDPLVSAQLKQKFSETLYHQQQNIAKPEQSEFLLMWDAQVESHIEILHPFDDSSRELTQVQFPQITGAQFDSQARANRVELYANSAQVRFVRETTGNLVEPNPKYISTTSPSIHRVHETYQKIVAVETSKAKQSPRPKLQPHKSVARDLNKVMLNPTEKKLVNSVSTDHPQNPKVVKRGLSVKRFSINMTQAQLNQARVSEQQPVHIERTESTMSIESNSSITLTDPTSDDDRKITLERSTNNNHKREAFNHRTISTLSTQSNESTSSASSNDSITFTTDEKRSLKHSLFIGGIFSSKKKTPTPIMKSASADHSKKASKK